MNEFWAMLERTTAPQEAHLAEDEALRHDNLRQNLSNACKTSQHWRTTVLPTLLSRVAGLILDLLLVMANCCGDNPFLMCEQRKPLCLRGVLRQRRILYLGTMETKLSH
jgi:hypothetical protein